ncbi:MAG: Ldh family oxidoreductase [Symbiobacteriaceae bacterium]|nr:Ldh family oxidoreductase [Symbiobacteriaceae bacterium]
MDYQTIPYDLLYNFCHQAFKQMGFTDEEATIITDVLIRSDLYGIESHGVQRLIRYDTDIRRGLIHPHGDIKVVFETPISAVIDGQEGMGQLIAHKCMSLAITKAQANGIGMVTTRNSNHYGIAGFYAQMACDQGLLGMSFTNSSPLLVPTYARKAALGSNPVALAMPAEPYPFLFDASTTVITRGKVEVYNKNKEPLYPGWAVDERGVPTTDAQVALNALNRKEGGILPIGGSEEATGSHKGYGFAMISEICSAIFSLGTTSNHTYQGQFGGICHGFMAMDLNLFGDAAAITQHLSDFLEELRSLPKADGADRIYSHGEKEVFAMQQMKQNGIPVNQSTLAELIAIGQQLGVTAPLGV